MKRTRWFDLDLARDTARVRVRDVARVDPTYCFLRRKFRGAGVGNSRGVSNREPHDSKVTPSRATVAASEIEERWSTILTRVDREWQRVAMPMFARLILDMRARDFEARNKQVIRLVRPILRLVVRNAKAKSFAQEQLRLRMEMDKVRVSAVDQYKKIRIRYQPRILYPDPAPVVIAHGELGSKFVPKKQDKLKSLKGPIKDIPRVVASVPRRVVAEEPATVPDPTTETPDKKAGKWGVKKEKFPSSRPKAEQLKAKEPAPATGEPGPSVKTALNSNYQRKEVGVAKGTCATCGHVHTAICRVISRPAGHFNADRKINPKDKFCNCSEYVPLDGKANQKKGKGKK